MIPATELAAMMSDAAGIFDKVGNVTRASLSSDGYGNQTPTYSTVPGMATVPCNLSQVKSGPLIEVAGKVADISQWVLTVATSTDIHGGDRVVIGGLTFEVNDDNYPMSFQVLQTYLVVRVS